MLGSAVRIRPLLPGMKKPAQAGFFMPGSKGCYGESAPVRALAQQAQTKPRSGGARRGATAARPSRSIRPSPLQRNSPHKRAFSCLVARGVTENRLRFEPANAPAIRSSFPAARGSRASPLLQGEGVGRVGLDCCAAIQVYARFFFQAMPNRPAAPLANSQTAAGSGTAATDRGAPRSIQNASPGLFHAASWPATR